MDAAVPIVKIQRDGESVDLQWLGGCTVPGAASEEGTLTRFEADDPDLHLPSWGGPATDCILLARLFLRTLRTTTSSFSLKSLHSVRQFARQRHLYGSKFSFPGGSAWATLLWSFCMWLDRQPGDVAPVAEVLQRFFTALAIWPWPLPWPFRCPAWGIAKRADHREHGRPR